MPARRGSRSRALRRPLDLLAGRSTLLLLGLALVCTVTLAPHVRLYVSQEREAAELQEEIDQRSAAVTQAQEQLRLWDDDAYAAAQARERLHYVFPGETGYVVPPGAAQAGEAAGGAVPPGRGLRPPWYRAVWDDLRTTGED